MSANVMLQREYDFHDDEDDWKPSVQREGHELEYHDDSDDECYSKDDEVDFSLINSTQRRNRPLLAASLPPAHELMHMVHARSFSADSSDHAIIPKLIAASSSDSQANDSLYENATSAMTSYVASLPLSSNIYIDCDLTSQIWRHAGQQHVNFSLHDQHHPQYKHRDGVRILPTKEHASSSDYVDYFGCSDLISSFKELTQSEVAICTSELFGITTTIAACNGVEVPVFIPSTTTSAMALSAIAGGVLCGPLGFLLGGSAIGLVSGYGQMSNENRDQLYEIGKQNVNEAINATKETAKCVSELFSKIVRDTDVNIQKCSPDDDEYDPLGGGSRRKIYSKWYAFNFVGLIFKTFDCDQPYEDDETAFSQLEDVNTLFDAVNLFCSKHPRRKDVKKSCLIKKEKEIRIATPINKIHSLPPHLHAAAWMGIVSSYHRSIEDKHEALQELLVLVKDKNHAKKLLDQGILDSLLYILSIFFKKFSAWIRQHLRQRAKKSFDEGDLTDKVITCRSTSFLEKLICNLYPVAFVTCQCCIALGKAHCSLISSSSTTHVKTHCQDVGNNGENVSDFLINISIQTWQKLARLLYEIPHHLRTGQDDDDDIDGDELQVHLRQDRAEIDQQLFVLVKWTVLEAQDMARLISCLETGALDPRLVSTDPERLIRALSGRLAYTSSAD